MPIKEMAEEMGFEVLHGIVDCLWVIGEPISVFKEAVERETGILTEVDTYDWITFLPMSDGGGAYNRYFGRLNTGKMKIRGVIACKGDTPEYVNRMQQEVFEVLAEAKSLEDLRRIEPKAQQVYRRYLDELDGADVKELAIHRRVSRLNYSRRCAEASAVQAHMKQGLPLAPGMEIGYVIRDARKWEVDPERTASKFDAVYYRGLLEKAWGEAAFVLANLRFVPGVVIDQDLY
jgi:DNA polymerase, archaea type